MSFVVGALQMPRSGQFSIAGPRSRIGGVVMGQKRGLDLGLVGSHAGLLSCGDFGGGSVAVIRVDSICNTNLVVVASRVWKGSARFQTGIVEYRTSV